MSRFNKVTYFIGKIDDKNARENPKLRSIAFLHLCDRCSSACDAPMCVSREI